MIDIRPFVKLYGTSDFQITNKINPWNTDDDKRFVFIVQFADKREIAIKVCRNAFTTPEKVAGWQRLCQSYVDLGIYCPRILNSVNNKTSETICIDNEEYIMYAEEVKKYRAYDELPDKPAFESLKPDIIESIGKVAARSPVLLPFPSAFCIYDTFDTEYTVDENYENAESFCAQVRKHFPEQTAYTDSIWALFLQKRNEFEPIHKLLPKASFQSDLNPSNILVDDDMRFAGYVDFNLSDTETVLGYIVISEVCGYQLGLADLTYLTDEGFLRACDAHFYQNIRHLAKHYTFSDYEKEHFGLCYNTVYPFSCWSINYLLDTVIKGHTPAYAKPILDWVYYQLSRSDISIS